MTGTLHPAVELARTIPEEGLDVLSAIMRMQEADRDHGQRLLDRHTDDLTATLWAQQDGVAAAFAAYEWGGTTASYEHVLRLVEMAMRVASYGPVHNFYRDQITARREAGECYFGHLTAHEPWPAYDPRGSL